MLEVVENLAPNRLGRADAHGIGVFGGLVGQARRMQSAEHDLRPAPLPPLGQFVGPAGRRDVGLDADQIHVAVDLGRFDVLVADVMSQSSGVSPAMVSRLSGGNSEYLIKPKVFVVAVARPAESARVGVSWRFSL